MTGEPLVVARTRSADETRAAGAALAAVLEPADVILLSGGLGAGKTAFVQGLGRGLAVAEQVTSPTFTLVRSYGGRWAGGGPMRLLHADVYRLERLREIVDLALAELVEDDAAAVVEWGEVAEPALGPDFLDVHIDFGEDDDERILRVTPVGTRWQARRDAVARALGVAVAP